MLRFTCPGCRIALQAEPRHAGVPLTCPRCRQVMRIPAAPVAQRIDLPQPTVAVAPINSQRPPKRGSSWPVMLILLLSLGLVSTGAYFGIQVFRSPRVIPGPIAQADPPQGRELTPESPPQPDSLPPAQSDHTKDPPPPLPTRSDVVPPPPTPDPVPGKLDPQAPATRDRNWFVCYPRDGQDQVPLDFSYNEVPDPLPELKEKLTGYPLTVTFARGAPVRNAKAELKDSQGKVVPIWLSSPEQPANPRHTDVQANTICIFAHKPLQPGSRYSLHVTATVDGNSWDHKLTFTTVREQEIHRQIDQAALGRINEFRRLAGLAPVVLDADTSAACAAHARYLALNLPSQDNLNWSDELPDLPGHTSAGKRIGQGSAMFLGGGAVGLIDWMMASFFNRHALLEPSLRQVGLGYANYPGRGWIWVLRARADNPTGPTEAPQVFPVPGQREVPTSYTLRSRPLPLPAGEAERELGFAITARLPWPQKLTEVQARLSTADNQEVPIYLSTPEAPVVAQFRQFWIGIVPRSPLGEGVTYTVRLSGKLNGSAWEKVWSFTTLGNDERKQREMAEHILQRLNAIRALAGLGKVELDAKLSEGCLLHARFLARHIKHPSTQGLGMHNEDPTLDGFTAEGQQAGRSSVIASDSTPRDCVDGWIGTLYHRIPLLHPNLHKIGFGMTRLPDQNTLTVLDCASDVRRR